MYRDRLTITLDNELLKAVDTLIDQSSIRSRSHAIEHLLREGLALHELTSAVIRLTPGTLTQLPALIPLFLSAGISRFFLIAQPGEMPTSTVHVASFQQFAPHANVTLLPGEFGSGGAITIAHSELTHSFIYCNINGALPPSILPAYVAHRRSNKVVTQLLTSTDAKTFQASGLSFISPMVFPHIPAGLSELEDTVFPALLNLGTLVGYVY